MKNSMFVSIAVVVVIVIVGLGIWWAVGQDTPAVTTNTIEYRNPQYGFSVTLPTSWSGYSIVDERWVGTKIGTSTGSATIEGPKISIRHPGWTSAVPRQDIPVLVFTLAQWNLVSTQDAQYSLGAAPIPPRELARNSSYVLALPARYNFAYPVGFEEVDQIISDNNFSAINQ